MRTAAGRGGSRGPRLRPTISASGTAVLLVLLVLEMGTGSGSIMVLVLRAIEMVCGRWYPALPRGTERP